MLTAVKSLYSNVSSCIRVNGYMSDWFDVKIGLRQGCILSPVLFNCFINDLAVNINALGLGINIGNDNKLSILMYADDVVLLAENEHDLQTMLNTLSEWCNTNKMSVNMSKSNIMHFRTQSMQKSQHVFMFNNEVLQYTDKYTYLGLVISEHMDYNITAKFVAQAAGRALGLLIAKFKSTVDQVFFAWDLFSLYSRAPPLREIIVSAKIAIHVFLYTCTKVLSDT